MYCKNPVCGSAPGKPVPKPKGLREMAMSRTLKVRSTKLPICMSKGGAILHRNSRAQLAKALQRRRPRSLAHHDRSGHWLNSGYGLQPLCQPKPYSTYSYIITFIIYHHIIIYIVYCLHSIIQAVLLQLFCSAPLSPA